MSTISGPLRQSGFSSSQSEARTKLLGFIALTVRVLWIPAGKNLSFFAYFLLTAV